MCILSRFTTCIITTQGLLRVFGDMTDIVLDVPNAYHTLGKFIERGMKDGFVSVPVAEQVPQRYVCTCRSLVFEVAVDLH